MTASVNNRRVRRNTIARDGVLVSKRGLEQADCTIADISTTGAGIRLPRSAAVPDALHLIVMAEKRAYAAMVMWRKPGALGLKFVSMIDLGQLPSKEFEFLNRVWIERSGR